MKTFTYDAAGNPLSDGLTTFTWNAAGKLSTTINNAKIHTYKYNALDQRITKNGPLSSKFMFFYDPEGQLIGEYRDNASTTTPTDDWLVRQETIWLEDIPVAVIRKPTATSPIQIYYVHADHLNTPRVIVNTANTIVWRWENTHPFGANLPDEDPDGNAQLFEYHPRFPGQYFDKETNVHYNYFRYYEPETGRYISPDPIGLAGGINIYGYGGQNPLGMIDPYGLETLVIINNNTPIIGTHTGLIVGQGFNAALYDPAGSYRNLEKGSGAALYGKDVNLKDYIRYQKLDGSNIRIFRFSTSPAEEELIKNRIETGGFNIPGSCAIDVSNALKGIGPFKNLETHITPNGLNRSLNYLRRAE